MSKKVPIETLCRIFVYDGETGNLSWSFDEDVSPHIRGKQAFTSKGNHGYRQTKYRGIVMLAHRVAWVLMHGEWPLEVDHINGDKTDNRAENLRNVTHLENCRNACKPSSNKSGFTGVSWDRVNKKWVVRIKTLDGKYANLGRFETIQDAINARILASEKNGYHPNHGRAA
jgi:hypothetical protein